MAKKPAAKNKPELANTMAPPAPNFDMDAEQERRRRLQAELDRSDPNSKRAMGFAEKLASQRDKIIDYKQSQGMETPHGKRTAEQLAKGAATRGAKLSIPNQPAKPQTGGGLQAPPQQAPGTPIDNGGLKPPAPKTGGGLEAPGQQPFVPQTGGGMTYDPPGAGSPPPGQMPPGSGGSYGGFGNNYGGYGGSGPTDNPYGSVPNLPGMFSRGAGGMQAPMLPGYNYQGNNSPQMLSDTYNRATEGSIQSYNTAANRLRERLDSASAGQSDAATNRNLARGFGNSGINDADQFRIQQNSQNAYAQGLNDLSNQFEQNRLQGLNTALGAANSMREGMENFNALKQRDLSQLRDLNNSNYQFGAGLDTQNRQFMDRTLFDLINNRESRGSAGDIARGGWQNALDLERLRGENDLTREGAQREWQGGQNAADRDVQRYLGQMSQNGANWRTSLENLFNLPGFGGGSGGRSISAGFGGSSGGGTASFGARGGSSVSGGGRMGFDLWSSLYGNDPAGYAKYMAA